MKNIKCLVTAGCSFSQYPNMDTTWPFHLNEWLKPEEVLYLGQGAAGNGIISRKVIYHTTQMLKKYKPEEILVGVVWSCHERKEIYSKEKLDSYLFRYGQDNYANPVNIVDERNYYIINHAWDDNLTRNYKKYLYRRENTLLESLDHILRVQWFLKCMGVKYFMTEFDYTCLDEFPFGNAIMKDDKDLEFFYSQIDKTNWLPINNLYEWAKEESGFNFARPPDPHPSTEQHKAFTNRVIVPFLLENKMVYDILT